MGLGHVEPPSHPRQRDSSRPVVTHESRPGAAWAPLPRPYRRREPEKTAPHAVVREHLETFLEDARLVDGDRSMGVDLSLVIRACRLTGGC